MLPGVAGAMPSSDDLRLATPGEPSTAPGERARAGQWNFTVRASGALTLTDNVDLAPSGQEEADLVLGLSFPLGVRREGTRMRLKADYVPTAYLYARNGDSNELQNNLRSLLTLEAVDDFFFVDASANSFPTYASPFLARPESGASITQNRVQQTTLGLSPYLRHQTSTGWRYLLRNENYWNTYSESELSDSATSRIFAEVETPPARINYALDYTYLYSRDQSQPVGYYQQVGRFRPIFRVTRKLEVSGRLGYESNDYVTDYSGSVYGAGVDWTPNPRTRLDGFVEHRFFGTSYGLDFNYRTRRTTWRLNGTRNTYTTIDQPITLRPGTTAEVLDEAFRSKISDPVQREQAVKQFLARAGLPPTLTEPTSFYTNQIYLAEQVSGSVALLGRRNTIDVTVFWQENQPVTASGDVLSGVFLTSDRLRQWGVTLNVSHRVSAFSTVTLHATRLYALSVNPNVAFADADIESTQDTVRLGLTRQLSPKTDASVGLRWSDFDSVVNPYRELAALAVLGHSF